MKFILVSHGGFAKGLLESAQMIAGEQADVVTFGLYPEDDINQLKENLEEEYLKSDKDNVVFFSDLYHGSPFNAVVYLMGKYDVCHITGMNMPVMLEAFMTRNVPGITPEDVCKTVMNAADGAIMDVRKFLTEVEI